MAPVEVRLDKAAASCGNVPALVLADLTCAGRPQRSASRKISQQNCGGD